MPTRCPISASAVAFRRLLIASTILIWCVASARADVTNAFTAAANAYVYRGSANTDEDESQTLVTKRLNDSNSRISYVRFNLGAFLSNYPAANITSARLRLYFTGGAADSVNVYGLDNTNQNGVSDGAWTANMTWNNQPAKTASPNDIPNSGSALPNSNTTAVLGSQSFGSSAGEVDIALSVVPLQLFLLADTNQQITLLFHNVGGNTESWASMGNTSGFLVPTLEIAATPSAGPQRALTWDGTITGNWDTNTANWKTNPATASTVYNPGDFVTFNDSKTGSSTVTLAIPVSPGSLTVSNSTANYTFSGSGKISGLTGISKQGTGALTISTSNDFYGGVIVSAGTLKAGNASAFGAAAGGVIVSNGATLDVNAQILTSDSFSVSGAGVGGNGAIINSGGPQNYALRTVTLQGDTTFGGTGRWDIRNSGGSASLSTSGQPCKLTKIGANQISLVGANVDSALGDIEVRSGLLSVETSTTGLGNPANTLSVSNGATLQFYQTANVINKNVLLAGTILMPSGANSVTFGGPINLVGGTTINLTSSTALTLTNVISGSGSMNETGSGVLTVSGTNTYSGATTINGGKFVLNGQLTGGGALTTVAGSTFAPNGGTSGSANVSGALYPGDLTGIGTFNCGGLIMNYGATATFEIRSNQNDLLQVNGNLTLNNNTLTIVPLDDMQIGVPYTLATYTGTLSGTFNPVLNLDTNFSATLDYSTPGQINLIFSQVQTFTIPTAYPTGPGPMNVTLGPDGKLVYWPDTNGDTIPDFSQAGYMGGGVAIPTNIPVVTTLSPSGGDDSVPIQAAIDNLAAQPLGTNGFRGVIYLNPGVYAMSNGLNVTASGIVLRGAGWSTNGTLLHLLAGHAIWTVYNPSGVGRAQVANTLHNIVSPYVPLGANWFTMDSVSNLSVGDDIVVFRPSTTTWINAINTSTEYPISWKAGQVDLSLERKIVAIEGNRVQIDAPIFCAIDQQYGGGQVYKYTYTGRVQNVGLEDIRADCAAGVDTNGNTSGQLITYSGVMNCWVRGCMNDKMAGHTVKADGSKWCTFEDIISFHNPLPGGHSGASIQINTYGSSEGLLFHRFTTSDGGFEFSSGGQSQGANVICESDIPHSFASTGPHMDWNVGTLYDAMFMHQGLSVLDAGGSHGWQGANHLAWNDECSSIEFDRPFTAHQTAIGLVSGSSNPDPVRNGTFATEIISWQSHVDPRSLYRAQLAERVGAQTVLNVLGQPYGDNYFVVTPATNSISTAPNQNTNLPVVLTTTANYPGTDVIPNPAGSVAVYSWSNSSVGFTVNGLPWNCGAQFASASLSSAGTNVLNVIASNNAPVGSYLLTVEGSSAFPDIRGGVSPLNQFATVSLNVTGPNNFLLSATPAGQTMFANSTTNFTVQVNALNGFNDTVALSITNLPPGVSASFSPPAVSGAGSSILTLTISNNATAGNYTLTILGANGGLTSGATVNLVINSTALPSPWADTDVGNPANTGSGGYFNGVFTGIGGGSDIWGTSDQFNYIFQPQVGDFSITARITSQTATGPWAKAGVMIRETTNSNSTYVFAMVTPTASHGVSLQYRNATGGSAADAADVSGPTVPYWVRLVRSGSNFTGFMSSDGTTWTQITNAIPITMSSNVMVGLAVCAVNSSALSTATFDNVSIDYPYFTLSLSPPIQGVNGNSNANYTVSLQNYFGFSGNVALSAGAIPPYSTAVFSPASISGTNVSTLTITTTNITPPDSYNLDITGTNGTLSDEEFVELVVTNTVDTDGDGIPDWWMQQYFGHPTGSAADNTLAQEDFDGDGMSNLAEYYCGTDPTDPTSYLHMLSVLPQGNDEDVSWSAIGGINYVVQSATNLSAGFTDISPMITPDSDGMETYLDAGAATNSASKFYRVRLGP